MSTIKRLTWAEFKGYPLPANSRIIMTRGVTGKTLYYDDTTKVMAESDETGVTLTLDY